MKRTIVGFVLPVILLTACHKDPGNPVMPNQISIVGKWNVDTVTTYFYDAGGLRQTGVNVYPAGAPDYPYRFQFNNDHSWAESSHFPSDADYIVATGTYVLTSDSTFTLTYPSAVAGKETEPCKIISISGTSFVFSKELSTVFNGIDPGYIKYVFRLTKL